MKRRDGKARGTGSKLVMHLFGLQQGVSSEGRRANLFGQAGVDGSWYSRRPVLPTCVACYAKGFLTPRSVFVTESIMQFFE